MLLRRNPSEFYLSGRLRMPFERCVGMESNNSKLSRRLGFDGDEESKEQPKWDVRLRGVHAFLSAHIFPAARYLLLFIAITAGITLLFVAAFQIAVSTYGVTLSSSILAMWADSLAAFENIAFVTGDATPSFVVNAELPAEALRAVESILFMERLLGLLANPILIAIFTAVALRPINPLWISPRIVLDTSQLGKERLTLRYWIRYPESRWMHNCTCLVRFQSDAADRSIDQALEIDSEHMERHEARRGVCEVNLRFDDVRQDFHGEAVGSVRKRTLTRMLLAHYAEAGCTYRVRFGSYEELVYLSEELKQKYSDYQILFRVTGVASNSRNVLLEKKYGIEDVLFGFVFKTPEEVIGLKRVSRTDGTVARRYGYNFDNAWRVEACHSTFRPIDMDVTGVDSSIGAMRCFVRIGTGSSISFIDSDRPVSPTARIYMGSKGHEGEYAHEIYEVMSKVYESLNNKDTYVTSTEEKVKEKLKSDSFACMARVKDDFSGSGGNMKLVGFTIFQKPSHSADNYGYAIGLSEAEASEVLMIDSVAVLPQYRGQGLQRRMLAIGEEEGARMGCRIFIATVDPRNAYSLANFIDAGYRRLKIIRTYGGKPREILVKRFRDSFGTGGGSAS